MSKDLLHQRGWEKDHHVTEEININNEWIYSVWTWSCGMGWVSHHSGLTLEEARQVKTRYKSTLITAKIMVEVK